MGRDVEAQSRVSEPDQSEKGVCIGVRGYGIRVATSAGKDSNHMRDRSSCGRLATYEENLSNK